MSGWQTVSEESEKMRITKYANNFHFCLSKGHKMIMECKVRGWTGCRTSPHPCVLCHELLCLGVIFVQ